MSWSKATLTHVCVIPTRANRIRAAAEASPKARPLELARQLGARRAEVEIALGRGDRRRIKAGAK